MKETPPKRVLVVLPLILLVGWVHSFAQTEESDLVYFGKVEWKFAGKNLEGYQFFYDPREREKIVSRRCYGMGQKNISGFSLIS